MMSALGFVGERGAGMGDSMRTALCLLSAAGLLLAGCGRTLHSIADVAENTRTATEQMASATYASDVKKEIEIYPDATALRRRQEPLRLSTRYETRQGPDGFMVYDTQNHTIARIANQSQAGLTQDQAREAAEALSWANDHNESIGQLK
jgi:hypothetical protein